MASAARATLPEDSGNGIQLAQLLLNASGTKGSDTVSASSWANQNSQQVFSTAMGKATNDDEYSALIQNILNQSAISFAPTLSQGLGGSGLYNSSTVQLLQDNARGAAVGQATGAVTSAKQNALNTAASISNSQMNTNKTSAAVQKPGIGDMITSALPGMALGVVGKGLGLDKLVKKGSDSMLEAFGLGNSAQPIAGFSAEASNLGGGFVDFAAPAAADVGTAVSAGLVEGSGGTLGAAALDAMSAEVGGTLAGGIGAGMIEGSGGAAGAAALDAMSGELIGGAIAEGLGAEAIGSAALGIGAEAAMGAAAAEGLGVAMAAEAGAVAAAEAIGIGEILGTAAAAYSVVCIELKTQGMATADQVKDSADHANNGGIFEVVREGYHMLGIPLTLLMRKYRWVTAVVAFFMLQRTEQIQHELGKRSKPHYGGIAVRIFFESICAAAGIAGRLFNIKPNYAKWIKSTPDWKLAAGTKGA